MNKKILIGSIILVIIDQFTKYLVNHFIMLNNSIKIIDNFFYLSNVHNDGAAWNILSTQRLLLILIGICSLYIIYKMKKDFKNNKSTNVAFSFLYAGIVGNLIDRVFFGYVKDFIDLRFGSYHYPVFNISDSLICIGVIILIIKIVRNDYSGNIRKRRNK